MLQGIAWTKMLVEYSASDGLLEGTRKTFDGEHPCSMCKSITEGKKTEQSQPLPATAHRDLSLKEITLPSSILLREPHSSPLPAPIFAAPRLESDLWSASPPIPPPRPAAA